MKDRLRILITGFGPFPGAPFNPIQPLVARLLRLRRPAFDDIELSGHIFPVTYKAVDRELPQLLAEHRPQALLMFGLASRAQFMRIETRARNAVTTLWPDADHACLRKGSIDGDAHARMFGTHTAKLLRAAVGTGLDARASHDAGSYPAIIELARDRVDQQRKRARTCCLCTYTAASTASRPATPSAGAPHYARGIG